MNHHLTGNSTKQQSTSVSVNFVLTDSEQFTNVDIILKERKCHLCGRTVHWCCEFCTYSGIFFPNVQQFNLGAEDMADCDTNQIKKHME